MTEKLKPCPFCGAAAEIEQLHSQSGQTHMWMVSCSADDCDTLKDRSGADGRERAIAAWNRRAPFTIEPEMVEAVAKAMFDDADSYATWGDDSPMMEPIMSAFRREARAAIEALLLHLSK